jgi:hypothetical protein
MKRRSLRRLETLTVVVVALFAMAAPASAQSWPQVFDPFVVRTFNLELEPADWDVIRFDTTNEIEVPAMFWADDETPILVSVRRKSSRALPSVKSGEGRPQD